MLTRRQFSAGTAGAALLSAIPGRALLSAPADFNTGIEALHRLFPTALSAARALGESCLARTGSLARVEPLMDELCQGPVARGLLVEGRSQDVRAWVESAIRADFAAGRTVRVEGWVLSATEARMFALVALS